MDRSPIKALLLDFDGTLADSLTSMRLAYRDFAARYGFTPSDNEFDSLNGPPLRNVVATLIARHDITAPLDRALGSYWECVDHRAANTAPSAGASAVLAEAVKRGWKVGIVTSNSRAVVERFLHRHGLSDTVGFIVDGSVSPGKPDPAPYLAAVAAMGISTQEAIAVEDSGKGIAAALTAGISCLAYTPLGHPIPNEAERVITYLPHLFAVVDNRTTVTPAKIDDIPFFRDLRNREEDVEHYATPRILTDAELEDRFSLDPARTDRFLMAIEHGGQKAGMLRFDRRSPGLYEIGIALAPGTRGKGIGRAAIAMGIEALRAKVQDRAPEVLIDARVAPANAASMALFAACGFQRTGEDDRFVYWRHGATA